MSEGSNFENLANSVSNSPDIGTPNQVGAAAGQEREKRQKQMVANSRTTRKATGKIITTRQEFKDYLVTQGLDLLTSAVEFQKTGDFVLASMVIYPKHNNFKEPLSEFLVRYPQLQSAAKLIRDALKPYQKDIKVVGSFG
ncbi:MAG: hypothetical protein H7230_02815 [Candidatus Parcubacteria bacterium]|nr:hypothetical protein [Candidatus Paceibacterota bacterium]